MVLLINACARAESRTLPLAYRAARKTGDGIQALDLYRQRIPPLDPESLAKREACVARGDYSDAMFRYARQFQAADRIVVAAPYWDLSFPAVLKCYMEAVCVSGLTFRYTEQGIPEGLCRAETLIYVTTAGGTIPERNFGYDYFRALCTDYFGIGNTVCIKAEGLDIEGADVPSILAGAQAQIERLP